MAHFRCLLIPNSIDSLARNLEMNLSIGIDESLAYHLFITNRFLFVYEADDNNNQIEIMYKLIVDHLIHAQHFLCNISNSNKILIRK